MTDLEKGLQNNTEIIEFAMEALEAQTKGDYQLAKECLQMILDLGKENSELLQISLDAFAREKESSEELTERLRRMETLLDDLQRRMTNLDRTSHESFCRTSYRRIWGVLDQKSKDYLITSSYLSSLIRINGGEYSPAILEMGRAVENELREKLFDGYIRCAAAQELLPREDGYDPLFDAVDELRRRDSYYISMNNMFTVLSDLLRAHSPDCYARDFLSALRSNDWDSAGLSDRDFTRRGVDYTRDFRNRAAHPSSMQEQDRQNCKDKTKDLLQHYFSCNSRLRGSLSAEAT